MCRIRIEMLRGTFFGIVCVMFLENEVSNGQTIDGNTTVREGDSRNLRCFLSTCNTTQCTYKWSSTNIPLPVTSQADITLSNVLRLSNGGILACTITVNGTDLPPIQAELNVLYGPSSAVISVNGTLTGTENTPSLQPITCSTPDCNPTCQAKWFNGSTQMLSTTLLTTNYSRYHTGLYTCKVSNEVGQKMANLTLTVYYGPDSVDIRPTDPTVRVDEGQSINVTCAIKNCYNACNLQWKNSSGVVVPSQSVTSLLLFSSIQKVYRQQTNPYVCTGTNLDSNKIAEDTVTFDVQYTPDITLSWAESTKTFTCTAAGNPTKYTFSELEHRISDKLIRNISLQIGKNDSRQAVLQELSYQDKGTYTCIVENGIISYKNGKTKQSQSISVTIKRVPILLDYNESYNESYNVSKGYNLTATIPIYSFPSVPGSNITVELEGRNMNDSEYINITFKNGKAPVYFHNQSVESDIQTLTVKINETREDFFGDFIVNFTNAVGTTTVNFTIFPQGPPDTPLRFEQQSITYHSVTFSVESGFFNGGDQTFVLQYRRVNSDSYWVNGSVAEVGKKKHVVVEMTVDGLSQVTDYEFRVCSFNIFAQSQYSVVVQVATALHVAMVVGVVLGSIAGIVLVILVVFLVWKKTKVDQPPKPIVPFTNILASLKKDENKSENAEGPSYPSSTTAPENIYVNTSVTKLSTARQDSEEPYVNQNLNAPDRKNSVDNNGYLKVQGHSNDEEPYMNVDNQLKKTQIIVSDSKVANRVYQNTQLAPESPAAQWAATSKSKEEEDNDDYLTMDLRKTEEIYENTKLAPSKAKPKKKKGENLEDDYVAMKKRNSTPNYNAPALPSTGDDEEDYVNTTIKKKKLT